MIRAILIIGLAALVLMAPALVIGAPAIDSATYTYVWTHQYAVEMSRGVLYPRWLPQSFEGLGAPTFYFYPPLAFYLSGALATIMEVKFAVSWAGSIMLFASGLAMFVWLRGKTTEAFALVGALIYMAAPYHLADFYVRSALAEFGAFIWIPLIALAIENQRRRWGGPLLAVSYAALVCTHLPVALLTSVTLIPPLVVRAAWKDPMIAARCAVAGFAGLLLSALYLAPALTLQSHTLMPQVMWAAHFDIRNWSALRLLGPEPDAFLAPTALLASGWAVVALAAMTRGARFWPLLTLALTILSLGLTPLFNLPILDKVQFPWRALALIEFTAITAAVVWRPRPVWMALGLLLLIPGSEPFVRSGRLALSQHVDPQKVAAGLDAVEYLPSAYTPVPKGRYPTGIEDYRLPLAQGAVTDVHAALDGTLVVTAAADGPITVRKANFPRWRVTGPDGPVAILLGPLVSFDAKAGQAYRLEPVATQPEVIGGWLSLFGLVLTGLLWGIPGIARLRSVRDTLSRGT